MMNDRKPPVGVRTVDLPVNPEAAEIEALAGEIRDCQRMCCDVGHRFSLVVIVSLARYVANGRPSGFLARDSRLAGRPPLQASSETCS
jgi:hypothetical protein